MVLRSRPPWRKKSSPRAAPRRASRDTARRYGQTDSCSSPANHRSTLRLGRSPRRFRSRPVSACATSRRSSKPPAARLPTSRKRTVILDDESDFAGMNEEWGRWFTTDPPARQGAKLPIRPQGMRISIAVIAVA